MSDKIVDYLNKVKEEVDKITPDVLKAGVTIFGITGTLDTNPESNPDQDPIISDNPDNSEDTEDIINLADMILNDKTKFKVTSIEVNNDYIPSNIFNENLAILNDKNINGMLNFKFELDNNIPNYIYLRPYYSQGTTSVIAWSYINNVDKTYNFYNDTTIANASYNERELYNTEGAGWFIEDPMSMNMQVYKELPMTELSDCVGMTAIISKTNNTTDEDVIRALSNIFNCMFVIKGEVIE